MTVLLNMRKSLLINLLLFLIIALSATSCSGKDASDGGDADIDGDIENADSDGDTDYDAPEAESALEEDEEPGGPFRVAVISDTHILPDPESKQVRKFVDFANYVKSLDVPPDLVFDTGDNIEDMLCIPDVTCEDPPGILLYYRQLIEENYDSIGYHIVMGNHDNRFLDMYGGNDIPLAMWYKAFEGSELFPGPRYYFDHRGFRFVVLFGSEAATDHDTNDLACFGSEQLEWLDEVLTDAPPALLFWHQMIDPQAEMEKETPNPILQVIEAHKDSVKAAFAGHGHVFARIEWQGVMFYETNTLGRNSDGTLPHHMLELDPQAGSVTVLNADEISYSDGI